MHTREWLTLTLAIACTMLTLVLPASNSYGQTLTATQARFLALAENGVAKVHRFWWNGRRRWFDAELHDSAKVATLWDIVPLFEALDGIAVADPTPHHKSNVTGFADFAESYLNHSLDPVPGFAPEPGQHRSGDTTWFDDNGWWGLAFLDAYRATGKRRYIGDAETAFRFIATSGWDSSPSSEGLWWSTQHTFFAGETLASGTELAARLYAITHNPNFLAEAQKFIAWGGQWLWNPAEGLYARLRTPQSELEPGGVSPPTSAAVSSSERYTAREEAKLRAESDAVSQSSTATASSTPIPPFDPTPLPYVQGPMIIANQTLCESTGVHAYCDRAEELGQNAAAHFPELQMGPQYDRVYLQDMLDFYTSNGNPEWYQIAKSNALRALANAPDGNGLYLKTWAGRSSTTVASPPGSLQLDAATISVFAWLAAVPPGPSAQAGSSS